jgi:hypothetical protein
MLKDFILMTTSSLEILTERLVRRYTKPEYTESRSPAIVTWTINISVIMISESVITQSLMVRTGFITLFRGDKPISNRVHELS